MRTNKRRNLNSGQWACIAAAADDLLAMIREMTHACLVRIAEIHENSKAMALDSKFVVYRKSRRKVIPLLRPLR